MNHPSTEDVEKFCGTLWVDSFDHPEIEVEQTKEGYSIKVTQMYEYVPLDLKRLLALAEFFNTKNIDDDRCSRGGCETCDYGSSYEITLTVREEEA